MAMYAAAMLASVLSAPILQTSVVAACLCAVMLCCGYISTVAVGLYRSTPVIAGDKITLCACPARTPPADGQPDCPRVMLPSALACKPLLYAVALMVALWCSQLVAKPTTRLRATSSVATPGCHWRLSCADVCTPCKRVATSKWQSADLQRQFICSQCRSVGGYHNVYGNSLPACPPWHCAAPW